MQIEQQMPSIEVDESLSSLPKRVDFQSLLRPKVGLDLSLKVDGIITMVMSIIGPTVSLYRTKCMHSVVVVVYIHIYIYAYTGCCL